MNTTDFLNIACAICPDRDLILFEGKRFSFEKVNDRVNRLANGLKSLGIKKGDVVGFLDVNCNQYIETYFACAKLGVIFVPLNFRAKSFELSYMISNAEASLLFVGEMYMEVIDDLLSETPSVLQCISLGPARKDYISYENLMDSSASDDPVVEIDDDDVTILMYTAGTTGRPKGVALKHSGFVTYMLNNVEPANPEIEERNLLTVPMYHVAGIQAMLAGVYGGRTLVVMRQFEVKEWMKAVQREKATRAMLVPTMLKRIVDNPEFGTYDLTSLQIVTYGAAPMPLPVIKKAIELMPWVHFINAFGQTETASTIAFLGPEDHVLMGSEEEINKKLKRLASSIGKPLSDVEVKIVDENEDILGPNQVGEILVRGPRVMSGYWKDEQKTAQVMTKDGWLRTSDRGYMDEDGYMFLAGRSDDIIIRGGENISPSEVESVLDLHPDIEEAVVIGVPDPEWGQEPRAIVVLKKGSRTTEREIIEYCRPKLAGFKRPKSVIFVDALPRSAVGKVLRNELRKEYGQGV
ncbi:MAG: long-chain-fatty-acid--CoA ligase [Deltaproteobacteria bacterium]|nr:long-chain-fatty-acid--CoA ligase [Deltaproteobacteria bacterium]